MRWTVHIYMCSQPPSRRLRPLSRCAPRGRSVEHVRTTTDADAEALRLGNALAASGHHQEAVPHLQQALSIQRSRAMVCSICASRTRSRRWPAASPHSRPDHRRAAARVGWRGRACARRATRSRVTGDSCRRNDRSSIGKARTRSSKQCRSWNRSEPVTPATRIETLLQMGDWYQIKKSPREALSYYQRAWQLMRATPGLPEAVYQCVQRSAARLLSDAADRDSTSR